MDEKPEQTEILSISEFVENREKGIYGFTVTYKNKMVKNFFIQGNYFFLIDKIKALKRDYKKYTDILHIDLANKEQFHTKKAGINP